MPKSLGLGGDGDEVEAIRDVEQEFEVTLDKEDAPNWHTVGDVYSSLQRALPPELRNDPCTWQRFCKVLCKETGADSTLVDGGTRLLAPAFVEQVKTLFKER